MRFTITKRRLAIYLFLYFLTFHSETIDGGNMQNMLMDLATSIVEWGRLSTDETHLNSPDVSYYNGHYYSGMGPGASILLAPTYALAKLAARVAPERVQRAIDTKHQALRGKYPHSIYNTPFYKQHLLAHALSTFVYGYLAGLLCFLLLYRLAFAMTRDDAAAKIIGLAFSIGTFMIYYNVTYYTQSMALPFMLLAIYLLLVRRPDPVGLLAGGFCAALTGAIDYPYFMYAGLIMLGAIFRLWRERRSLALIIMACLGFAIPFGLLLLYHAACFGSPLRTPAHTRAEVREASKDFYHSFNLPTLAQAKEYLCGQGEGIVWYAPFCLLFPFGIYYFFRRLHGEKTTQADEKDGDENKDENEDEDEAGHVARQRRRVLFWVMTAIIAVNIFHVTRVPWTGSGAAFGPRYLLPALPFLVLFAYPCFRWMRVPFAVLLAVSFVLNHLGMLRIPASYLFFGWLRTGQWEPITQVRLFPIVQNRFAPGAGLLIDAIYQLLLLALVFGVPWLWLRRLGVDEVDRMDSVDD